MANENPNGSQNNNRRNDQNDNKQKGGFPSWLILLAIVLAITIFSNRMLTTISGRNSEEVRYDQFLSAVNHDEVAEVTISNEDIRYVLRADKDKTFEKTYYTSVVPGVELTNLVTKMQKNGWEMTGDLGQDAMTTYLISYLLMPVVLFVILWLISRRIIKRPAVSAASAAWAASARARPRSIWKGDRRDLQRCGRAGRGKGIACRDHRLPA